MGMSYLFGKSEGACKKTKRERTGERIMENCTEKFPCDIGTKVYFAFSDTGNIEEDVVIGFKGLDDFRYVLLKKNTMITMSAFKKYACYSMEQAMKRLQMERGVLNV